MSDLTSSQIETFDRFAIEVAKYLDNNSAVTKNPFLRIVNTDVFVSIWKTISRPSGLKRVMHTLKNFEEFGRTKRCFQLRDEKDNLLWKDEEQTIPEMSPSCCVMYSGEAYREFRARTTGLKTREVIYAIRWANVPKAWAQRIAHSYFPSVKDYQGNVKPKFLPTHLALVLRKGEKPSKGEKRHNWAGFDFIVTGKYGDDEVPVVIRQVSVIQKPYLPQFAELMGVECPDYGSEEPFEELEKAACSLQRAASVDVDMLF